jgi:predicted DNA-binding WGR domain protein
MPQVTTKKRRFEFVQGTSCKFWEIMVSASGVHVQFGRIGTDGQGTTKLFPDESAAAKHADTVVRAKLAKGYVEVSI